MSYQSSGFILFSALCLLLYYTIGRKKQIWVLCCANLAFYAIAGIKYIPFIAVTTVVTYLTGKKIGKIYNAAEEKIALCTLPNEKKLLRNEAKAKAKKYLIAGMVVTIALLAVCKYTSFVIVNINSLLSAAGLKQIEMFKMLLPLGISFYTFMALSYVLDIYWKRYKAENNFLTYAAYLTYFPHVVQGPIDRFNEFKAQIKDAVPLNTANLASGAQLAIWGFFKKLVIADRLGLFVDTVFDSWRECDGIIIMLSLAVYSIQIYTDFSGCIDIVRGISEMFGITLRRNFNHPYFSRTMPEFWRRWHISLQEWFKDYVYYPVSASSFTKKVKKHFKNKNKPVAMELFTSCFPILVVWLITGIWHGAAWKYVAWGIYHATLLIASQVFAPLSNKLSHRLRIDTDNFGWHFLQMCRTFILCCIGRIFFRADGLTNAIGMAFGMISKFSLGALFENTFSYGLDIPNTVVAVIGVAVLLVVDILQEKIEIRKTLAKQNLIFRWLIIFAGLFAVIIFGIYGPGYDASSFIYEQF